MSAGRHPPVSVIVVSYNRSADLRLSLQALLDTGYPALELIVVDNASADDAAEVAASFPAVKLIRSQENLGFAGGNNLGLAHASGEYVALVNNDAVVEPDWIGGLVRFLEAHPEAAGAGGKAHYWSERCPVGDRGNPYYSYSTVDPSTCHAKAHRDTPDEVRDVVTLSGCAVMLRRRAIDEVGPVFLEPEFFTYYEETDFFARLLARGWRLYYTGRPAVWHRVGGLEPARLDRYLFYMHRNRTLFAWRNLGPAGLRAFLRRQRAKDLLDRLRLRLGRANPRVEARRRAQRWLDEHRPLLERHRAGSEQARDERWAAAVRRAQAAPIPGSRPPPAPPPLVSIVIANHDLGRYAGEAIASALAQTHPAVEVIVVDDGSRDDSLERIEATPGFLAGKVQLVAQANAGVCRARNAGAAVARGQYLVFLDADDLLEPAYVERCLAALQAAPPSVAYAYARMRYFGAAEGIYRSKPFGRWKLVRGNFVNASALMRRGAFEAVGGFDPDFKMGHEDHAL
ncbi:MAG TPA: glycosyltransferase, partial [Anaeromyxobacteraceae bacterium]|nr:glycosyltransferase [Anaeromyxobacteraceae bacterium]